MLLSKIDTLNPKVRDDIEKDVDRSALYYQLQLGLLLFNYS